MTELAERPGRGERAVAARNRRRILAAASRQFAARGPEHVTMEDIAHAVLGRPR